MREIGQSLMGENLIEEIKTAHDKLQQQHQSIFDAVREGKADPLKPVKMGVKCPQCQFGAVYFGHEAISTVDFGMQSGSKVIWSVHCKGMLCMVDLVVPPPSTGPTPCALPTPPKDWQALHHEAVKKSLGLLSEISALKKQIRKMMEEGVPFGLTLDLIDEYAIAVHEGDDDKCELLYAEFQEMLDPNHRGGIDRETYLRGEIKTWKDMWRDADNKWRRLSSICHRFKIKRQKKVRRTVKATRQRYNDLWNA